MLDAQLRGTKTLADDDAAGDDASAWIERSRQLAAQRAREAARAAAQRTAAALDEQARRCACRGGGGGARGRRVR